MSSDAEKQKRRQAVKKYLVFALMFLVFAACMWFIFAPSDSDRAEKERQEGFNTELPDPRNAGIVDDKMTAYEQESMRKKREEKMRTLEEMTSSDSNPNPVSLSGNPSTVDIPSDVVIVDDESGKPVATSSRGGSFSSSHNAHRQINETLGSFYEQPVEDSEKEAMREEIEQLRQSVAQQQQSPGTSYAEQVALLEKSYELAAKYMPNPDNGNAKRDDEKPDNGRKAKAVPVGRVSVPVVSSLAQPVNDSVMIARLSEPRNFGFNTAVGGTASQDRNTISVCVHGDQTVISGQSVRLRLLEPMRVGRHELPRNSLITGDCRIQGERLDITISQVEYSGNIIPVELAVYDNDGQPGIFIPGSMEANAVKEMAANMGQNLGATISITNQSAGDQLLSELGKGAIQGVSQYISKKMRQEKVRLKSGHALMLYQKQ